MVSGFLSFALIAVIAYFLGAIPFAQLVSRARGVDIFKVGSGNAGFTNVLRVLGGRAAAVVLVGDILKGTLAAGIGDALGEEMGMLLASAIAVIAHTLSVFVHFRGGKGVATGAGVLLYVSPLSFWLADDAGPVGLHHRIYVHRQYCCGHSLSADVDPNP